MFEEIIFRGNREELIKISDRYALVLSEPYGELGLETFFGYGEESGDSALSLVCLFDGENESNVGKRFIIPIDKLISYEEAVRSNSRTFLREGDLVVGLKASDDYTITSYLSFYVGEVVQNNRYGVDLQTVFSTKSDRLGTNREVFSVEEYRFIPALKSNPLKSLRLISGNVFSHIAVYNSDILKSGVIYPLKEVDLNENKKIYFSIGEEEERYEFINSSMTLIPKGDILNANS